MTPLFDKIQIEVHKTETVTSSGIHLATEQDKLEEATVVAVGSDCTVLKPGDSILFKSYSEDTIKINDKEYSFIKEEEALAYERP